MQTLFRSVELGGLRLRNRVIKTATYEGMTPGGMPSEALVEHHRAIAAGGVALTTLAYCAVSPEGRTFAEQLVISPQTVPGLKRVVDAVHREGGAISLQLGHCGYFTKNEQLRPRRPQAPSRLLNPYGLMKGLFFSKAMNGPTMAAVKQAYASAAKMAVDAGFDAIELHLGHGYLLSQFLSPWSNRRHDAYGGELAGRLRFPLEVVRGVLDAVGPGFPVLCKINLSDGFAGGSEIADAVQIAQALEQVGVHGLVLSGGFVSRSAFYLMRGERPLREMIRAEPNWFQKLGMCLFGPWLVRRYPFEEMFFLEQALRVREAVRLPLVLLGGIVSLENMQLALQHGFEMVALGRPLIHDPQFLQRIQRGELTRSGCTQCNRCVVEMDLGGVRCVLAPDQAREG